VNAALKVPAIVAGMAAGADSIDDLDLLRHAGMPRLFAGVRAPSTLGSFLRCLNWGNARQLDAVNQPAHAFRAGRAVPDPGRRTPDVEQEFVSVQRRSGLIA
jgi:hypothetical protein